MLKLIFIELRKVFKRKSILIVMFIMLLFNVLNNVLYYVDYDNDGNYKYLEVSDIDKEKRLLESELKKYNYSSNDSKYLSILVELNTKLDCFKIKERYDDGSWQYNKVDDYLIDTIEWINIYTYKIKDEKLLNEYKNKLDYLLKKFDDDDYLYFIDLEIDKIKKEIIELESSLKLVNNKLEIEEINSNVSDKKMILSILEYRLGNNVKEDGSYLNKAITKYQELVKTIKYYEDNIDSLSYSEKCKYQELVSELEINKYIMKNKINYNKENNLNYQLRTIADDYEIFIIIVVLIVASFIVAEEFTSGTIKLLLIKPYSRGKILLSKYFTIIIVMLLVILYLIVLELLVGGILFGIDSLSIPVIVYDFNKNIIVEYNVFIYMIIRIITKLPLFVMILTISFSLSTIINNIALSIIVPLFMYIFTPSISNLISYYKLNFLKYLVNMNWEFNEYLFGRLSKISGLSFKFSIFIWGGYFILIMIITCFNFKKKNIRNV